MSRKKIAAKTRRKDDLDPSQDQFLDRTNQALGWAAERRRPIMLGVAVAFFGAIVGIAVNAAIDGSRESSSTLLAKGLSAGTAPVIPMPEGEDAPPLPDDEFVYYESSKARATEALKRFKKAADEEGGSFIGHSAQLGAAAAHLELGEHDEAIAAYGKFLAEAGTGPAWMKSAALEGLGYAHEAAGQLEEAKARFDELAALTDASASRTGRYHQARLAAAAGKRDRAVDLLQEVVDEIAGAGEIDQLLHTFVQARELLVTLKPDADVPDLPGGLGAFEGMDPAMLQQLMQARSGAAN